MITLDNFENFVPYKIWMRGEEYYETDAVSELEEISPGEWTATVEGTDDYNVEISMDGNEIESWYCDCPYDGEICKHVVATLLAIRDNRKKAGNSIFSKMKIKAEETPVLEEIKEVGKQPCPSLVETYSDCCLSLIRRNSRNLSVSMLQRIWNLKRHFQIIS